LESWNPDSYRGGKSGKFEKGIGGRYISNQSFDCIYCIWTIFNFAPGEILIATIINKVANLNF